MQSGASSSNSSGGGSSGRNEFRGKQVYGKKNKYREVQRFGASPKQKLKGKQKKNMRKQQKRAQKSQAEVHHNKNLRASADGHQEKQIITAEDLFSFDLPQNRHFMQVHDNHPEHEHTRAPVRRRDPRSREFFRPEVFVQASFRLLIRPDAEVAIDDDGFDYVPWSGVVQAFMRQENEQVLHCPICLSIPAAPRVSKCGHVACLACFLRYFAVSERSRCCPLCSDYLNVDALRPIVMLPPKSALQSGDSVNFVLMKRLASSTIPQPVEQKTLLSVPIVDCSSGLDSECFARSMVPTRDAVDDIALRDLSQIELALAEAQADADVDTQEYLLAARAFVAKEREKMESIEWPTSSSAQTPAPQARDSGDVDSSEKMLFYQIDDQRPLFLHPMCLKALILEHGGANNLPATLSGTVVECESRFMDQKQRRREKALCHLPPTTTFGFVELDLSEQLRDEARESLQPFVDKRVARRVARTARLARDEEEAAERASLAAERAATRTTAPVNRQALPDFASFEPLEAERASAARRNSGSGGARAWNRLVSSGNNRSYVVGGGAYDNDFEDEFAVPRGLSLESFIVTKAKHSQRATRRKAKLKKKNKGDWD